MTLRACVYRFRSTARLLGLLLLVLPSVAWVGTAAVPVRAQAAAVTNPYGVNVFLHKEVEAWKIEKTLQMVAAANIGWIKQEFPWQEIEFKKGYFHDDKWNKSSWEKFDNIVQLADKYNLNIIARVDHPPDWAKAAPDSDTPLKDNKDLADFTNALLDKYNGRIKYVQIWNEPNLTGEWIPGKAVDPKGYVDMLKTVYPAVKEKHKDAVVLTAPMAMTTEGVKSRGNMNELDYWNGMYDAGVRGNFDIASANGYGLDQPPDAPPDPKVLNFRRVELIRDIMVSNGDAGKPIWFDEYGWNASPDTLSEEEKNFWRHVTPQQQADWTIQGIEYARKHWPWAGVISIWYFRQVGDIPPDKAEYYFAMVNPDFKPQPIYGAVKKDAARYTSANPPQVGTPIPSPVFTSTPEPPAATPTTQAVEVTPTFVPATAPITPTSSTASTMPAITPTEVASATSTPASVITATATPGPNAVAGASNSNTMLYVLGGLLVIGGLAGLGYYFMRSKQS